MNEKKVDQASSFIKSKSNIKVEVAVILGSGLGVFADKLENAVSIPYQEIPHFHAPTVAGHQGQVCIGEINGCKVMAFQGRFHFYEGHSVEDVVLPVRVAKSLGAKTLIITNAAGGINQNYSPGDLVCINDHINLTGQNPLIGSNVDQWGSRFPDMSGAYDKKLIEVAKEAAQEINLNLKDGTYVGVLGPSYETPAEIRMFRTIGGDLVGMSTVLEVIAATHIGFKTLGISCVTNMASGIVNEVLKHEDVKEVANKAISNFSDLLCLFIKKVKDHEL